MWNTLPPYQSDLTLLSYILHKSKLGITGAKLGQITFDSKWLSPHPPLHSMGKLTIGNMLMGRSCRGYWGVSNEKFLQEVPFNNEIHGAEILMCDEENFKVF